VFQEANVDTSIFILQNTPKDLSKNQFPAVEILSNNTNNFPPLREDWLLIRPSNDITWRILSRPELGILDKMVKIGTPLKKWNGVSMYRGITTGYDPAFIIDEDTKDHLIDEDLNSKDILKPILKGGDIKSYRSISTIDYSCDLPDVCSLDLELESHPTHSFSTY